MIDIEGIPRRRLFGGTYVLISLIAHSLFFVAVYPSMSKSVMKPNVPVSVRIITDLPKPKKEETPIKKKTAPLANADRRSKGPKELERAEAPKVPKIRLLAKAPKPTARLAPLVERTRPKPRKLVVAKIIERPKILPRPKPPPPLLPSQGVPRLRKLPLLSGADLERYARLDPGAAESEVVSLDTRDFRYISYFATIKRQIELVWNYPEEAARAGVYGELMMQFIIRRDGRLEEVRLLRSSGSRILDEEAIRAVRIANPYNPFPKRITKKRLHINAVFSYMPSSFSSMR